MTLWVHCGIMHGKCELPLALGQVRKDTIMHGADSDYDDFLELSPAQGRRFSITHRPDDYEQEAFLLEPDMVRGGLSVRLKELQPNERLCRACNIVLAPCEAATGGDICADCAADEA